MKQMLLILTSLLLTFCTRQPVSMEPPPDPADILTAFIAEIPQITHYQVKVEHSENGEKMRYHVIFESPDKMKTDTIEAGRQTEIIYADDNTYIKDPTDSNWYLVTLAKIDPALQFNLFDFRELAQNADQSELGLIYQGEELCGEKMCYLFTDEGVPDATTISIAADAYRLESVTIHHQTGARTTMTYSYDPISVEVPVQYKELDLTNPSDATNIEKILNLYGK